MTSRTIIVVLGLGLLYSLWSACSNAEEATRTPGGQSPQNQAQGMASGSENGPTSIETSSSKVVDAPKPTHRTVNGPGYSLRLPLDNWTVNKSPKPPAYPVGSVVGVSNVVGCNGAIIVTPREAGETLEIAKSRSITSLGLKELQTIFENRLLYNSTTAYQYNVRGEIEAANKDIIEHRVQGTIMRDHRSFVEVRAWSSRTFETARSCHDTVTASFTNLGLGKLDAQAKDDSKL